jgi:hypothetical protein
VDARANDHPEERVVSARRKLIRTGVCAGLLVLGAWGLFQYLHYDPIRYENFSKIQNGMKLAEVEELLGCPQGDYATREIDFPPEQPDAAVPPEYDGIALLRGNQGDITVYFDQERVAGAMRLRGEVVPFWAMGLQLFVDRLRNR